MILHDGDRHRLVVLIQRRPEAVSALDRPACGLVKTRVAARLLDAAVRRAAVGLDGEANGHLLAQPGIRSEEHTSELQSLMRISYAVFCLKKKKKKKT